MSDDPLERIRDQAVATFQAGGMTAEEAVAAWDRLVWHAMNSVYVCEDCAEVVLGLCDHGDTFCDACCVSGSCPR